MDSEHHRPIDTFVSRTREVLKEEYLVIGKTRVSSLTSAVVLAFFLGMTLTIGFLASRTGTLEESEAAKAPQPAWSKWSKAREGSCQGRKISTTKQCRPAKVRKVVIQGGKRRTITIQGFQARHCIKNCASLVSKSLTSDALVSAVSLTVSSARVNAGDPIVVRWSIPEGAGTPTETDWIGFFDAKDPNTTYIDFRYITADEDASPCRNLSTDGCKQGSVTFRAPLTLGLSSGSYKFRYLPNNVYASVGNEGAVSVICPEGTSCLPPVTFITNPSEIIAGSGTQSTLSWSFPLSGGLCEGARGETYPEWIGPKNPTDTFSVSPPYHEGYQLTCFDPGNPDIRVTKTVDVVVTPSGGDGGTQGEGQLLAGTVYAPIGCSAIGGSSFVTFTGTEVIPFRCPPGSRELFPSLLGSAGIALPAGTLKNFTFGGNPAGTATVYVNDSPTSLTCSKSSTGSCSSSGSISIAPGDKVNVKIEGGPFGHVSVSSRFIPATSGQLLIGTAYISSIGCPGIGGTSFVTFEANELVPCALGMGLVFSLTGQGGIFLPAGTLKNFTFGGNSAGTATVYVNDSPTSLTCSKSSTGSCSSSGSISIALGDKVNVKIEGGPFAAVVITAQFSSLSGT